LVNFFIIILVILLTFCFCKNDEYVEEDKRTKLKACINLTKARFSQDSSFYEEARKLTQTENTQTKELIEKMVNMLLTNCNSNITLMQAADVYYFTLHNLIRF